MHDNLVMYGIMYDDNLVMYGIMYDDNLVMYGIMYDDNLVMYVCTIVMRTKGNFRISIKLFLSYLLNETINFK